MQEDRNKSQYVFSPSDWNKPKDKKFGTFDIETDELNAKMFSFGVVFDGKEYHTFFNPDEMINFMLLPRFKGFAWYAHNSEYDLSGLFENIITAKNEDDKLLFSGSQLLYLKKCIYKKTSDKTGKTTRHYISFYDSFNYFKTSVKKLGEAIGVKKFEVNYEDMSKRGFAEIAYCKRDCKILFETLKTFFKLLQDQFHISPKLTIASIALATYKTNYLNQSYFIDPEKDGYFQQSYYGGRTEVFKRTIENGHCFDVNSLYPYSMICGNYPDPSNLRYAQGLKVLYDLLSNPKIEGVADVTVSSNLKYPILPYRNDGKLYFPTGAVSGFYNFNELRFALENGYELLDAGKIVYSEGIESPFIPFVHDLYELRKKFKADGSVFELFCKYILNSLYGKFGEMREKSYLDCITAAENYPGAIFEEISDTGYGYWKFANQKGEVEKDRTGHTIFSWCSYITSYARITLYKYMQKVNFSMAYCDTDSLFVTEEMASSKELGEMKKEYDVIKATFIKPKHYEIKKIKEAYNGNQFISDQFVCFEDIKKMKGVSDPDNIYLPRQYIKRLVKSKEALRRGLRAGEPIEFWKDIELEDKKRKWIEEENDSEPYTVEEIFNLEYEQKARGIKKLEWFRDVSPDEFDFESYEDSTLTKHENEEIKSNIWRDYLT